MQKLLRFFPEILILGVLALFTQNYLLKNLEEGTVSAKQIYGSSVKYGPEYRYEIIAQAPFRLVALSKAEYSVGQKVRFFKETHVVVTIVGNAFYITGIGNYLMVYAALLFVASGFLLLLFLKKNRQKPDPMALVFSPVVKRNMRKIFLLGFSLLLLAYLSIHIFGSFGIIIPREIVIIPGDGLFVASFYAFYKYLFQLHLNNVT